MAVIMITVKLMVEMIRFELSLNWSQKWALCLQAYGIVDSASNDPGTYLCAPHKLGGALLSDTLSEATRQINMSLINLDEPCSPPAHTPKRRIQQHGHILAPHNMK